MSPLGRRGALAAALVVLASLGFTPAVAPARAADPIYFSCANGSAYLSSAAPALTVPQGQQAVFTIDIHRISCPDSITFTYFDNTLPAGTTTAFSQNPTTADVVTLTVTTSNTWPTVTPLNTYGVQLDPDTGHTYPGSYLTLDITVVASVAPVVRTPTSQFSTGSILGSTSVPVRTLWPATDPDGIARYQVQRQANGGSWKAVTLTSPTATSVTQSLSIGTKYRYRVRATDRVGHTSAYAYGRSFVPKLVQQSSSAIKSAWRWTTAYTSSASGGSLKYQPYAGADFTFTFAGSSVAWVGVTGPTRTNLSAVWVDGLVTTWNLNLSRRTTTYRKLVYVRNFGTNGKHTLHVRDDGQAGHSRIDIDAFVLLIQL